MMRMTFLEIHSNSTLSTGRPWCERRCAELCREWMGAKGKGRELDKPKQDCGSM